MWMVVAVFFAATFYVSESMVRDRVGIWVLRLYLGWWAISLLASSADAMGIDPVSHFAYFLLLLNVGMFTAGFIATGQGRETEVDGERYIALERGYREHVERSRPVVLALVGLFLYLLRYFLKYVEVLAEVGPAESRSIRFDVGPVFGSPLEILVYNGFAEALAIGLLAIVAYSLVLGSVRNWVFAWALVDLLLFAAIGAGRTILVEAVLFIFLLALLRPILQGGARKDAGAEGTAAAPAPPRRSLLVTVGVPAVLVAALMVYLTFARLFNVELGTEILQDGELWAMAGEALFDNLWSYSVGPFRALDQALQRPSLFGFQFGRLTFGAVDEMIGYPLRMIGFDYPIMNTRYGVITQDVIFIGSGDFNALYTCVARFYYDFGVAGVAVLSLAFGAVVRGAVAWFQSSPSIATLAVLLYLSAVSILSTQTWHLASTGSMIFLAGAFLAHRLLAPQE